MAGASGYHLEPFNGKSDFSIWQQKMKGILIQQKCFKAIDQKYSDKDTAEIKSELDEFAYSSIILNLSDAVLRKVGKLTSAKALWEKLQELYTETSLPSKLFLLEKFFRFKLDLTKDMDENLDVFTKLIQDIKLTVIKTLMIILLLCSLNAIPDSYVDVKSPLSMAETLLPLISVINGLKSKELDLKISKGNEQGSGKVMHVGVDLGNRRNGNNNNETLVERGVKAEEVQF
ncbi:hypothetical protein DH2020_003381 [Rehmannia glutinosa]|uniref:Retrovirus-related Pol polyprotein from transposon TNT 1-94 n=1 Tax=Rehmannia glutinosa TaxID=99300 RepID=A0ABR0XLH0_REHGL